MLEAAVIIRKNDDYIAYLHFADEDDNIVISNHSHYMIYILVENHVKRVMDRYAAKSRQTS